MTPLLLLLTLFAPQVIADTSKPADRHSLNHFLEDPTKFGEDPKSTDKSKMLYNKNQIALQLMGSTPFFGLEYNRRVWEDKKQRITIETGFGLGITTLGEGSFRKTIEDGFLPGNISHNVRAVFFRKALVHPYVGYYGILIGGGNFSNDDRYAYYRPNFGAGLHFGDSDTFTVSVGATAYVKCCMSGRDPIGSDRYYSWVLPSFGLHASFGRQKR